MKDLKKHLRSKHLHGPEKTENWWFLYHCGLFDTMVFIYDYHYLFVGGTLKQK